MNIMSTRTLAVTLIIMGSTSLAICPARAQSETNIAPRAQSVLASACEYLAQTPYFGLTAEIWREHVTASGQKLQFSRTVTMEVRRPNRLHMEIAAPRSQRGFWYDGKSLTILDRLPGLFSMAPMPGNLDAMIDKAHDDMGVDLPLIDLAVSDPYKNAMAKVVGGSLLRAFAGAGGELPPPGIHAEQRGLADLDPGRPAAADSEVRDHP